MNQCNINFRSEFAVINGHPIHINEYIKNKEEYNLCTLLCCNQHELICVNGDKNKKHFRHKHSEDVEGDHPMTAWHCEWQGHFPITEKKFKKLQHQNKLRQADVVIEDHKIILEIQHSPIPLKEVEQRNHDYGLHGHKVLWIIDGNETIQVTNIKNSDRIFLEFYTDVWKYKSFQDIIYVNIDTLIYKINPTEVKSDMIDVEPPIEKDLFIQYLNENNEWLYDYKSTMPQCNLYIKQQGAGNGKTFGLIQKLQSIEFEHYKYIIIVTKQHSAKYVIYNEFKNQIENGYITDLNIIEHYEDGKKYIINYKNKSNIDCSVIIATIDSLMYSLGNKNHTELDKFKGIVNSIINDYTKNVITFNFGGMTPPLNKEFCLISDETQDLSIEYGKAIIQIMKTKYIDAYIVGDKLQSIMYNENAFTYLMDNEFNIVNKIFDEPTNVCRRFYHPKLVSIVNDIVPFDKFQLKSITPYQYKEDYDNPITIFQGRSKIDGKFDLNTEVESFMNYYINEVDCNNYKPNDFLIITPFTSSNELVDAIETAVTMYWNNKYKNNEYERYAIFHKSDTGTSINLAESENSTRIVSIHTSKGDGRPVVFVIGLNERSLLRFSKENNNLLYESLIHVALTRMKKKLYIRYDNTSDDIYHRLMKYINTESVELQINKNVKYKNIISLVNDSDYEQLKIHVINKLEYIFDIKDKQLIDMQHHKIRYITMSIQFYIKIIRNKQMNDRENLKTDQIYTILNKIHKCEVCKVYKWKEYYQQLNKNKNIDTKDSEKRIAILKLSDEGNMYGIYFQIICDYIDKVKLIIKRIIDGNNIIICPMESIILFYMMEIFQNGNQTNITINELYYIVHIYYTSFNHSCIGHNDCLCKRKFLHQSNEDNKLTQYLLSHYQTLCSINKIYDVFLKKYTHLKWNKDKMFKYNGKTNKIFMYLKCELIGYDDENVYIIYIKPQLNEININEVFVKSIFDTYLLYKSEDEDVKNKNIKIIIFTSDKDHYIEYEMNVKDNMILLDDILYDKICKYFQGYNNNIYNYYTYIKNKEQNIVDGNITNSMFIIKTIINTLNTKEKKDIIPEYIFDFLKNIKTKIEDDMDDEDDKIKQTKIINGNFGKYRDFHGNLNKRLDEFVSEYMGK
jgi:hypothetical protein